MSRIHEALRKAEQEQAQGRSPEESSPGAAGGVSPSLVAARESAGTLVRGTLGEAGATLAYEDLSARCVRPTWAVEPKVAQLLSSAGSGVGNEELRTLRSRLYQIRDRQPLKKILVTSPLPGEGKTFLTAALGHIIARQHGRRSLIIDADLRHSQMHRLFGAPMSPGLTDFLRGDADEYSILQRGSASELFLIPGGKPASNPSELLANGRMKLLLDRLAPLFDWILLDSPPVVPIHDASVIADFCDGVLLVVNAGSTPFDLAQKARAELKEKGLLGVVLNRVAASENYHQYYYNYYGQKNGSGSKKPH